MDFDALNDFAQCISNKNIKVILVWTDVLTASQAISKVHENESNQDCIFLATAQWAIPPT